MSKTDNLNDLESMRLYIPREIHDKSSLVGGQVAGLYLESIQKTDLSTLTPYEWKKFCHTFTLHYENQVNEMLEAYYSEPNNGAISQLQ